jgi:hypothetical protein
MRYLFRARCRTRQQAAACGHAESGDFWKVAPAMHPLPFFRVQACGAELGPPRCTIEFGDAFPNKASGGCRMCDCSVDDPGAL